VEGVLQDEQFAALSRQYAAHRQVVGRLRSAENHVARAWSLFVEQLDGSPLRPGDLTDPLLLFCEELGIDDRVPRRGAARGWSEILDGAYRAYLGAAEAWSAFLADLDLPAEVRDAFADVERAGCRMSPLEQLAEDEWRRLEAAARDIGAFCRLREDFLCLVASLLG